MNYAEIKPVDIANCIGVGVSLYVSGCRNHCEGCFNSETWDFNYGKEFTDATIKHIINLCEPSYISTLTILGGDPMEPENREDVLKLCKAFRREYGNTKKLWLYTGYYFEDLIKQHDALAIIQLLDTMIDGPFELENKVVDLKLRGSTNQRIIPIKDALNERKLQRNV